MHVQDLAFDTDQLSAIQLCTDTSLSKRIVAITGAAGTGKTTIIRESVARLRQAGLQVAVCAPTGKAARRITQLTGHEAVTIHKLLEFPKPHEFDEDTGKPLDPEFPRRHKDNRLEQQVIICDEYAMVNHRINRFLIDAMNNGASLRCFGDDNQLQPIEEGWARAKCESPFQEYIAKFPSVTLKHVYRQAEGSGILDNATRITRGFGPLPQSDFDIRFTAQPPKWIEEFTYQAREKWRSPQNQIITPQNKGWVGTYEINQRLQAVLNPDPDFAFDPPRNKWQADKPVTIGVGDKVVCTENLYDLRDHFERYTDYSEQGTPKPECYIDCPQMYTILNGETGLVTDITRDGVGLVESIAIDVGDRVVQMPFEYHEWSPKQQTIYPVCPVKALDLGYALTTHKCQGSEYDEVVYLLNKSTRFMQNRRNLYTAVTRARRKVTLVTDRASLQYSVWKKG